MTYTQTNGTVSEQGWLALYEFLERSLSSVRNRGVMRTLEQMGYSFADVQHELLMLILDQKLDYILRKPQEDQARLLQTVISNALVDFYYQKSGRSKRRGEKTTNLLNGQEAGISPSCPKKQAVRSPASLDHDFFQLPDPDSPSLEDEDYCLRLMGFDAKAALVETLSNFQGNPSKLLSFLSYLANWKPAQVARLTQSSGRRAVYLQLLQSIAPDFALTGAEIALLMDLAPAPDDTLPLSAKTVSHDRERAKSKVYSMFGQYK